MKLPAFEYAEPKTLSKACRLLSDYGDRARLLAGGTDLLQRLKNRLEQPELVVDLNGIPRLASITFSKKTGLSIGALATLRQLAQHPALSHYPILGQAAALVGTIQLQAMGTVGGNLCQDNLCLYYDRPPMTRQMLEPCLKLGGKVCHAVSGSKDCWAVYSSDLAPVFLALGAKVVIAGPRGKRTVSLQKLYSGDSLKPQNLKKGEILTHIILPPPSPNARGVYLKYRLRKTIDYPLFGVALELQVDPKTRACRRASLALTGVDRAPVVVEEAAALKGKTITPHAIETIAEAARRRARPLGNVSEITPKYRREMVGVYVKRAFEHLLAGAPA